MGPKESNTSPDTPIESAKPYDARSAETYLSWRTGQLDRAITSMSDSIGERLAARMAWHDQVAAKPSATSEDIAKTMVDALEDALRQEKLAIANLHEMRALAVDYHTLPEAQRAECRAAYERCRQSVEHIRAAMEALLADPRTTAHADEATIAEIRRERPT